MLPMITSVRDPEAQKRLSDFYDKYYGLLLTYVDNILHHREDAEDCVQDVMCVLIQQYEARFCDRTEEDMLRFARVCCKNRAINMYNNKRKATVNTYSLGSRGNRDDEEDVIDVADPDADVVEMVINKENSLLILRLIQEMDGKYRDVLLLRYYYDYTNQQIARLLHITETLVSTRLNRAKNILKNKGGQQLYELL